MAPLSPRKRHEPLLRNDILFQRKFASATAKPDAASAWKHKRKSSTKEEKRHQVVQANRLSKFGERQAPGFLKLANELAFPPLHCSQYAKIFKPYQIGEVSGARFQTDLRFVSFLKIHF